MRKCGKVPIQNGECCVLVHAPSVTGLAINIVEWPVFMYTCKHTPAVSLDLWKADQLHFTQSIKGHLKNHIHLLDLLVNGREI